MEFDSGHNDRDLSTDSQFSMRAYRLNDEGIEEISTIMRYDSMRGETMDPSLTSGILTDISKALGLPFTDIEMAEFLMIIGNIPVKIAVNVKK